MLDSSAAEGRERDRPESAVDQRRHPSGIEWLVGPEAFEAVRGPWEELAERERRPFLRHEWFAAWWQAFGAGTTLEVCVVWDGDRLAAAFPLARAGARLQSLSHPHHAPVFRPLARDGASLQRVVREVADRRPDELVVHSLPAGDPAVEAIVEAAGAPILVTREHVSPLVDIEGDFASYRASLSRSARKGIERRRRRLGEEHGGRFEISSPVDVDREVDQLIALEVRGWKGARGTAVGQEPGAATFYRAVARAFHADGRVRVARIMAGDRVVAIEVALLDHGRLWALKGAYDEEFARYGPGVALAYGEVEWCFEQGLEGFELLGDDEPWKRTFATGDRHHVGVRCYRRRPLPLARFAYHGAVRPALRAVYRRVRPFRRGRA